MDSLKLRSINDVRHLWLRVREVPRRAEGRTKKQYERYYIGLYLLALAEHHFLSYPLKILEGERPDFTLIWKSGETTGLELTRATDESMQSTMAQAEKAHPHGQATLLAAPFGYVGGQLEVEWCALVRKAIRKKVAMLPKYRDASRHDLLVPDDTRMGAGDRRKVVAILAPWVSQLRQKEPRLGKISVVASLDVLYDIGEESSIFPFIQWSSSTLDQAAEAEIFPTETFSKRVEHAGRIVAENAIYANKTAGIPVCFIDSRGRLVKQLADGRRFEVRVNEEGKESMVRMLSRG